MIVAYMKQIPLKPIDITPSNHALLKEALWIDLISPTKAEEALVEEHLNFEIPTRDEMREIELSSRLYEEKMALFMTSTMLAQADSPEPQYDAVTFVLTKQQLVTLRYIEPQAFRLFISKLPKLELPDAAAVLLGLLDATVERIADILEAVGRRLEDASKTIFRPDQTKPSEKVDYQKLLQHIGINADINTKVRESLVSFNRLLIFFSQTTNVTIDKNSKRHVDTLTRDITALSDHSNFLSNKVNFLLDASLGMVTIDQNKVIKALSIAATVFLPPTLIAGIYGMNFHDIPELSWHYGYPMALGVIVLSAWLPYKYFKHRKWL